MSSHDLQVATILGHVGDSRFAGQARDPVDIGWGDAAKHRQVRLTAGGLTLRITLPRGSFLYDGAVLGCTDLGVVVVRRPTEPAVVVTFRDNPGTHGARRILLWGYLLGNQHCPVDVSVEAVAAPLLTSPAAAEHMLNELGLNGAVTAVPLARDGWSRTSADRHAAHHS